MSLWGIDPTNLLGWPPRHKQRPAVRQHDGPPDQKETWLLMADENLRAASGWCPSTFPPITFRSCATGCGAGWQGFGKTSRTPTNWRAPRLCARRPRHRSGCWSVWRLARSSFLTRRRECASKPPPKLMTTRATTRRFPSATMRFRACWIASGGHRPDVAKWRRRMASPAASGSVPHRHYGSGKCSGSCSP